MNFSGLSNNVFKNSSGLSQDYTWIFKFKSQRFALIALALFGLVGKRLFKIFHIFSVYGALSQRYKIICMVNKNCGFVVVKEIIIQTY